MRCVRVLPATLAVLLLHGAAAPLHAAGDLKEMEDAKRGFVVKVPSSFTQNPPKPGKESAWQAAEFYDDQAKYKSSGAQNPQLTITWWVTPKVATTPSAAPPETPGGGGADTPGKMPSRDEFEEMFGPKNLDALLDRYLPPNARLFGEIAPLAEKWPGARSAKTTKQKLEFRYLEFNATKPKKKDEPPPPWYFFVAKLAIERPTESIVVGFHGYCATQFADKLGPAYVNVVKSFETHDTGGSTSTRETVPEDPDAYRDYLKRTKVIEGWNYLESPKRQYVLIYSDGVDEKLIRTIAVEVESLRAQVYEILFPPDRPIKAVSVIRVCKDQTQYQAYHAPGGSAGYWSSHDKELVFYEDASNKKDSLRVLYHEAFHQYIYYSVGAMAPHSWFNEGHGDYFYGHNFKDGRWQLGKSLARTDEASKAKRAGKVPPLEEWLRWEQPEYYGRTQKNLTIYENYALGWELVYFLRGTKKAEYRGILDRYFNTLKGLVTAAHDERAKAAAAAKAAGQEPEEIDEEFANRMHEADWHEKAIVEGFKGVDLGQLYKDWMDFSP